MFPVHTFIQGTIGFPNLDEFLEKLQMAFDLHLLVSEEEKNSRKRALDRDRIAV